MNSQQFYTPSTPIQSQEAYRSVEQFDEQVPALWGQPPPLPLQAVQAVQYRTQGSSASSLQSSESSRFQSTPRPRTASSQPSKRPQSPVKELSKDDHILIFRLALQAESAYGQGTLKAFWQNIAEDFEKETGKKHKTLQRATSNIIKARRKLVAEEHSTGAGVRSRSSYNDAIDEWIQVIDAHSAEPKVGKGGQGRVDQATKASQEWRDQRFRAPPMLAKKRNQRSSSNASTDGNEDGIEAGPSSSLYLDQNTPIQSTTSNTPVEEGSKAEMRPRKRRRRTETAQRTSPDDLLKDFRRFVNSFEAHIASNTNARASTNDPGISELKADMRKLNERLGGLEKNMSSILGLLKDRETEKLSYT